MVSADESMEELLQAKYTNFANEDADYPVVTSIKKTGFMPTPRPTVASQAVSIARKTQEEKAQPKRFIMKRFAKVKGTFERERDELARSQSPTRFSDEEK